MKLKTKLIPLASAAAVCATVAPITLTSCGNEGWVDLTQVYKPSYERLARDTEAGSKMNFCQATNAWGSFINDHNEYFSQEYYFYKSYLGDYLSKRAVFAPESSLPEWGVALELVNPKSVIPYSISHNAAIADLGNGWYDTNITVTRDVESISNFSMKIKEVKYTSDTGNFTVKVPLLSFTFKYEICEEHDELYLYDREIRQQSHIANTITGTEVYTDVPFVVDCFSQLLTSYWMLTPYYEYMRSDLIHTEFKGRYAPACGDWSVAMQYEDKTSTRIETESGATVDTESEVFDVVLDADSIISIMDDPAYATLNNVIMSRFKGGFLFSWYLYSITYDPNFKTI